MSYLHDDTLDDDENEAPRDRELTLSTGTLLGIFFGLALLCGAFFAFGYNMGSRSRPGMTTTAEGPAVPANFSNFKPSPGSPAVQSSPAPSSAHAADETHTTAVYPAATSASVSSTVHTPVTPSHDAASTAPGAPIVRTPPAQRPAAAPAVDNATGSFLVQVAAVSHAEDADLLISALKRKGYAVVSRSEPQDKLFHIQVGPFAQKKDADAMRQRLLADGYNAILK